MSVECLVSCVKRKTVGRRQAAAGSNEATAHGVNQS